MLELITYIRVSKMVSQTNYLINDSIDNKVQSRTLAGILECQRSRLHTIIYTQTSKASRVGKRRYLQLRYCTLLKEEQQQHTLSLIEDISLCHIFLTNYLA